MNTQRHSLRLGIASLALLLCAGCVVTQEVDLPPARPGNVKEIPEFLDFINEYRPTPLEFQQVYPDITLVLPGEVATKELRMNNSRFFATLDDGQIVDGRFQ